MPTTEEPYPYNLPIWRRAHRASSPDGKLVAEIAIAYEISMSNPTLGTLNLSGGLSLEKCNPSFIWSENSRYLAVPQSHRVAGLFFGLRILVVDAHDRVVFASPRFRSWLQPKSFTATELVVMVDPTGHARTVSWRIPADLGAFSRLTGRW